MKVAYCVVNLVLITLIAGLAVDAFYNVLAWQFRQPPVLVRLAEASHDFARKPDSHPIAYYHGIVTRDLFKTLNSKQKESSPADDADHLETAHLDVKLWGTVSSPYASRFAVIEIKDAHNRRRQSLFREGDVVDTATIDRIMRDKVVVSVDGQRKVLLLENYSSQAHRRTPPPRTGQGKRTYRRTIRRSTVEAAVGNVGQLMTQAKIIPRNDGLAITGIKPGSLFRRLGLRNGDIIEGVNGRTIQTVDDALSLFNRLRNDASVSVNLKRRGQGRTIHYAIR